MLFLFSLHIYITDQVWNRQWPSPKYHHIKDIDVPSRLRLLDFLIGVILNKASAVIGVTQIFRTLKFIACAAIFNVTAAEIPNALSNRDALIALR